MRVLRRMATRESTGVLDGDAAASIANVACQAHRASGGDGRRLAAQTLWVSRGSFRHTSRAARLWRSRSDFRSRQATQSRALWCVPVVVDSFYARDLDADCVRIVAATGVSPMEPDRGVPVATH